MISKVDFGKFVDAYIAFNSIIDTIEDVLGISDLYESNFVQKADLMYDIFISSNFTNEGIDIINKYVFEKRILKVDDIEVYDTYSLYEAVKKYIK